MKKTLVAVAALAASAAFAQSSSVTLYGVADAYVGSVKNTAGVSQSVVNDGGLSQSRLGVSVKEDLGSGLAAFAVLENGLKVDTGATAGARKSVVGLSGSFGAVSLGRQTTPAYDVTAQVLDAQPESSFSAVTSSRNGAVLGTTNTAPGATAFTYLSMDRYSNSVRYDSANFDGFSGAVQYSMGENKSTTAAANNGASLNLKYANGPLGVAFAYQRDKNNQAVPTSSLKTTVLGGYYDFGPAKLNLGYTQFKNDTAAPSTTKNNSYNVGVTVPVGAFNIVGQYASTKTTGVSGRSNAFALEGQYALSKRTTTYIGLNETKDGRVATPVKTHLVGIGLRHVF